MFQNRTDAGRQLADALARYDGEDVAVLALPRGGVPVAVEIAARLNAPLDLLLVRKIGVPSQPELAMGAIMDGPEPTIVRNELIIRQAWVSGAEFQTVCNRELGELERRRRAYLADREPVEIGGRTVILVDDGIATGATMRAAVAGSRKRGAKRIVVAVPVAPSNTVERLRREADEVVCLEEPAPFHAIGFHYLDFRQLADGDVTKAIRQFDADRSEDRRPIPTD